MFYLFYKIEIYFNPTLRINFIYKWENSKDMLFSMYTLNSSLCGEENTIFFNFLTIRSILSQYIHKKIIHINKSRKIFYFFYKIIFFSFLKFGMSVLRKDG